MISLGDRAENLARDEVQRVHYRRVGGLSIFFEQILPHYFQASGKAKSTKARNGRNYVSTADWRDTVAS